MLKNTKIICKVLTRRPTFFVEIVYILTHASQCSRSRNPGSYKRQEAPGHHSRGAFAFIPTGRMASPRIPVNRPGENRLLGSIDEAIKMTGLSDGMTISFHHHLRYGDMVLNMVMERIAAAGIKGLRLAQSALFGVHEPLVRHIRNKVITRIGGSIDDVVRKVKGHGE